MPENASIFLKFFGKELINPITYVIAFSIGATINTLQGNGIFFFSDSLCSSSFGTGLC